MIQQREAFKGPQGPGQRVVGFYNISNGSEGLLVGPLLPIL